MESSESIQNEMRAAFSASLNAIQSEDVEQRCQGSEEGDFVKADREKANLLIDHWRLKLEENNQTEDKPKRKAAAIAVQT